VSSTVHSTTLARESAKGEELADTWMPDGYVDSNAAASARAGVKSKHVGAERDVNPGKHSTAECAVLCVVVSAQQARGYSVSDVQAMGRKAAADETRNAS
jgi:hypothetical protein